MDLKDKWIASKPQATSARVLNSLMTYQQTVLFLCAMVLGLWLYWDGLAEAVLRWELQAEYSHGYLIPLVSLFILWEKRLQIMADYRQGSWWGLPVIAAALVVLVIGEISALYMLIHYSFIVLLFGLSVALLGAAARHTWVAILLLGFAVPLPYFLEVILTAKLQLISSQLGVEIIRLCRIPVFLSGNIIDLGNYQLQVVEACSGLRYLFPLMSLGFISAYLYQAVWWRRGILFFSTIPITILMNSFRIAVTGLLVDNWGAKMAEGFLHDFEGWLIFMACGLLMLVEILLMERFTSRQKLSQVFAVPVQSAESPAANELKGKSPWPGPLLAALPVLILSTLFLQSIKTRQEIPLPTKASLIDYPTQLGEWSAVHDRIDELVAEKLGFTDYVMLNYVNNENLPINFYVAYYASQRKGVSPHSPKVCIPGGGWEIAGFSRTQIDAIPVNRALIRKGTQDQIVYYWFEERGLPVANEYLKKWMLFKDALLLNRTDGSLVRVTTPVLAGESMDQADQRARSFIRIARQQLSQFLPGYHLEDLI